MASKKKQKEGTSKQDFYFCTTLIRDGKKRTMTHSTAERRRLGAEEWKKAGYRAVYWTSKKWPCEASEAPDESEENSLDVP